MADRLNKGDPWPKLRATVNDLARRLGRMESAASGPLPALGSLQLQQRMPPSLGRGGANWFWAAITGSTSAGTNRWTYSWAEREKSTAGYGGWTAPTGGRSGSNDAYNSIEDMNDATGVQGNGVDVTTLDTADYTFELQPAPAGAIVQMHPVSVGSTVEYWFAYENGVDGECD